MRKLAPPGCKLIEWGHRLSFAYLSGWEGMDLFPLADHIVRTGGLLCSSCQVIYLDTDLLAQEIADITKRTEKKNNAMELKKYHA